MIVQDDIIWPQRTLRVCFRSPEIDPMERVVIQNAAHEWEKASNLRFVGWGNCSVPVENAEIGILQDENFFPHGMGGPPYAAISLRIDHALPGDPCGGVSSLARERCIMRMTTHEFGHVLGFPHQQNITELEMFSPPASQLSTCSTQFADGTIGPLRFFGPWDLYSIMNYCNPNDVGATDASPLSETDKNTAASVYGRPLLFADINGDGRADAIEVTPTGVNAQFSRGFVFGPSIPISLTPISSNYSLQFGDVDQDGDDDAILIGIPIVAVPPVSNGEIIVRRSNGATLDPPEQWSSSAFYGRHGVFVADVTGDGKADVISVSEDDIQVRRSLWPQSAGFGPAEIWQTKAAFAPSFVTVDTPSGSTPFATIPISFLIRFGDVDGDHRADMVLFEQRVVSVLKSQTNGTTDSFGPRVSAFTSPFFGNRTTTTGDFNGDGKVDLLSSNRPGLTGVSGVSVARAGSGPNPSFGPSSLVTTGEFFGTRGTYFANVDGDPGDEAIAVNDNGEILVRQRVTTTETYGTPRVWSGPSVWKPASGDGKDIAIVGSGSERFDAAIRATNDALYWYSVNAGVLTASQYIGGLTLSAPAIVRSTANADDLDIFVRGTDGALYWNSRRVGYWHGWTGLSAANLVSDAPAAVALPNGGLGVFVAAGDPINPIKTLQYREFRNGVWLPWTYLGISLTGAPTATADTSGAIWVFYRGAFDSVRYLARPSDPFAGFDPEVNLGGGTQNQIRAVATDTGHVFIAIRGTDGAPYVNAMWGWWTGWLLGTGSTPAAPALAVTTTIGGNENLDVFVTGTDGRIHQNRSKASVWQWEGWSPIGTSTFSGSPDAAAISGAVIGGFPAVMGRGTSPAEFRFR